MVSLFIWSCISHLTVSVVITDLSWSISAWIFYAFFGATLAFIATVVVYVNWSAYKCHNVLDACKLLLCPQEWLRSIVMSVPVCGSVCLSVRPSTRISLKPHTWSLLNFVCILPVSMARLSSDTFTIGRIAYHREGVFFPIENALSAGKGEMGVHSVGKVCYLWLPCLFMCTVYLPVQCNLWCMCIISDISLLLGFYCLFCTKLRNKIPWKQGKLKYSEQVQ